MSGKKRVDCEVLSVKPDKAVFFLACAKRKVFFLWKFPCNVYEKARECEDVLHFYCSVTQKFATAQVDVHWFDMFAHKSCDHLTTLFSVARCGHIENKNVTALNPSGMSSTAAFDKACKVNTKTNSPIQSPSLSQLEIIWQWIHFFSVSLPSQNVMTFLIVSFFSTSQKCKFMSVSPRVLSRGSSKHHKPVTPSHGRHCDEVKSWTQSTQTSGSLSNASRVQNTRRQLQTWYYWTCPLCVRLSYWGPLLCACPCAGVSALFCDGVCW